MTPELITLAREAMALEGAPVDDLRRLGLIRHHDREVSVDLAETSPAGWALDGVLLGALGLNWGEVRVYNEEIGVRWRNSHGVWAEATGRTLAEACCRAAVGLLGCWPGGLSAEDLTTMAIRLGRGLGGLT